MSHFSRYYWTMHAARGVNLRSRYGKFVIWFVLCTYAALCLTVAGVFVVAAVIILFDWIFR
jgi:hypothetical protein